MSNFSFEFDWMDASGIRGRELAATWATLKVRVNGSIVTRVHDTRAKTVRDFVNVPLYPLAEWLVDNWWFLKQEILNPAKENDPQFHRRHSLCANREGYAYPKLEVIPFGTRTQVVWKNGRSPWTGVEFLNGGKESIDTGEFQETCAEFIDQVVRRLMSLGVEESFLQQDWEAIRGADDDESKFCEAAASLGWDPYALDDNNRDKVLALSGELGELLYEAFPALDSDDPDAGTAAIATAISDAKSNSVSLSRLKSFRAESVPGHEYGRSPWDVGYELARQLRQDLDLENAPISCMAKMAVALGEEPALLEEATRPVNSLKAAPLIDGVVTRNDKDQPGFAFGRQNDGARRFLLSRGIAEVLTSPSADALITKAHSERQRSNRAFAAEFLAPSEGLMELVSSPVVDSYDIDEMAGYFGVSPMVIRHQVENHNIANVATEANL